MMRQELAKEIIRLRAEGQTIAYIAATLNLVPCTGNHTFSLFSSKAKKNAPN
jgi:hypothetical protein